MMKLARVEIGKLLKILELLTASILLKALMFARVNCLDSNMDFSSGISIVASSKTKKII